MKCLHLKSPMFLLHFMNIMFESIWLRFKHCFVQHWVSPFLQSNHAWTRKGEAGIKLDVRTATDFLGQDSAEWGVKIDLQLGPKEH